MPNLTIGDLDSIKHTISSSQSFLGKLNNYSSCCQDSTVKQMFTLMSKETQKNTAEFNQIL